MTALPDNWRVNLPPYTDKETRCILARSQVVLVARRVCHELATIDDLRDALAHLDREARA